MSSTNILLGSNVQFAYSVTPNTDLGDTTKSFGTANTLQAYVSREGTTFGTDQSTITPTPITQTRVAGSEILTARNGTFTLNGFGNWNADDDILGDALGAEIISGRAEHTSETGSTAATQYITIVDPTTSGSVTTHKFTFSYAAIGGTADTTARQAIRASFAQIKAGAILRLSFDSYKEMADGSGTTRNFNDPKRIFQDRRVEVLAIDTTAFTIQVQALREISQSDEASGGNVVKTVTSGDNIQIPNTESDSVAVNDDGAGFRSQIAPSGDGTSTRGLATAAFAISGFVISWKYAHFGPATRTRSWVIKTGSETGFTDTTKNKYHLITNAFVSSYNVQWSLQSERQSTMTIAGATFATSTDPSYVTAAGVVKESASQVYGSPVQGGQLVFIENSSGTAEVQQNLAVTELSYTISAESTPINALNKLDPVAQSIGVGRFQVSYSTVDTRTNRASELSTTGSRAGFTYVSGYKGNLKQELTGGASSRTALENKLFIMMMPSARFVVEYNPISANDAIRQRVQLSGDVLDETLAAEFREDLAKHTAIKDTPVVLSFE